MTAKSLILTIVVASEDETKVDTAVRGIQSYCSLIGKEDLLVELKNVQDELHIEGEPDYGERVKEWAKDLIIEADKS